MKYIKLGLILYTFLSNSSLTDSFPLAQLVGPVLACPEEGDTWVFSLELKASGPEAEPGQFKATVFAEDDSGDRDLFYTYTLLDSEDELIFSTEPLLNESEFEFIYQPSGCEDLGNLTLMVEVDDDPTCDDSPGFAIIEIDRHKDFDFQLPGDANQDGVRDISDEVTLLGYLFLGDPSSLPCDSAPPECGGNPILLDHNGDSSIDISDVIAGFKYLFLSGPPHLSGINCIRIPFCQGTPSCLNH